MSENFVKLDRRILNSGLLQNHNALAVFCYMLTSASWRREQVEGVYLEAGEILGTCEKVAEKVKLSYKQTRMAIDFLIKRETLGKRLAKFRAGERAGEKTIYILINWHVYQGKHTGEGKRKGKRFNDSRAGVGQGVGKPSILVEEVKKGRNGAYAPDGKTETLTNALGLPDGFANWTLKEQSAYWGKNAA